MVKNIPNAMIGEDLFDFLQRFTPNGFDFVYLLMDFETGEQLMSLGKLD
jgi:hypothetical protein